MIQGSKRGPAVALSLAVCLVCSASALAQTELPSTAKAPLKAIDQDIHVVVRKGELLSDIVQRVMGNAAYWEEVAEINKIERPHRLKAGEVIIFPSYLVQRRNFARVAFTKGDVTLTAMATKESGPLRKRDRIYLGDVIRTGDNGFVSLSFKGESLANIQPDSHVQIVEFDCFDVEKSCVVNISSESGQMDFDIRNMGFKRPARFTIDTPYASAAVRGTKLDVEVSDGSAVGVTSGVIEVSSADVSATVNKGKGTLAGEGRSVSQLYDLLKEPQLNDFTRLTTEDYLAWAPMENAKSYKVVLAEGESLTEIIRSSTTTNAYIELLPEPREYYLSARALDVNGLKGFKRIQKIRQVAVDENVDAPELEIELRDNDLTLVNRSGLPAEVHIGSELETIDGLEHLIRYRSHDVGAGETLELNVDTENDIYITARAIVGGAKVSSYGSIYEFKGTKK